MDHHFLPFERRIEIRDDANRPRAVTEPQRLGRRPILAPAAERARVELLPGRLGQLLGRGTRPVPATRCDDCEAARERVAAKVYCAPSALFASAVSRSIGIGNTIVELLLAPISSSVCK